MSSFEHRDLILPTPGFDSPLVDAVVDLEHLRRMSLAHKASDPIFAQLKRFFQHAENLFSARIEGNHSTMAEFLEKKAEPNPDESTREILNLERAMGFIVETVAAGEPLTQTVIRELHRLAVEGLAREGDRTPGQYRTGEVRITNSTHIPPFPSDVPRYMAELLDFVNEPNAPKSDLLKVAVAHHRFMWIHPFANGNGRTGRLFTYALLVKHGVIADGTDRIINPSAVFCSRRPDYYAHLMAADTGTREALEAWCFFVLDGIRKEALHMAALADERYVRDKLLRPALADALKRGDIDQREHLVLALACERGEFKLADLQTVLPGSTARQCSHLLKQMRDARLIELTQEGGKTHRINIFARPVCRPLLRTLVAEGLLGASET